MTVSRTQRSLSPDRASTESPNSPQKLSNTIELRELQMKFAQKALIAMGNDSKLNIQEDGEIVYDGPHNGMDSVFPSDGVIRIKKAPEALTGDTATQIEELVTKHVCPIKKQRVILKP